MRAAFQDAVLVLCQLLILFTDGTWHGCCAVLCCAVLHVAPVDLSLAVIIPMHLSLKHISCLLLYQSAL